MAKQVAKEVAQRVDGPANCDNETHGAERTRHGWGRLVARSLACLTAKISNKM